MMIGGQKGNYPTGNHLSTCCGLTPYKYANNEASAEFYAGKYLQRISPGQANLFKFKTNELTKAEHGELIMRLGIGRDHPAGNGTFVLPRVYFYDTEI